MMRKHKLAIAGAVLGAVLLARWACRSEWPDHEGKIRQTAQLSAGQLRRGGPGYVSILAEGLYVERGDEQVQRLTLEVDEAELALIDAAGVATPLAVKWKGERGKRAELTLPEVADGDYKLRATYHTKLGKGEAELALPLYSPARIHVITDRPLYEAGNVVHFRAVVLRARDLVPLDRRPGRWLITDPQGQILLEEKAPAGDFGVVAGSFPLDKDAAAGSWNVQWLSSDQSDTVSFEVRPFTLPRFRVEATASQPFYSVGEVPVVRGAVVYSSGAPVAGAQLELTWQTSGAWPPPREWQDKLLPKAAVTRADGQFELTLPEIPQDLQGQVTLAARLIATDPAGDRVESQVQLLLSADKITVSAVTELGEGLVEGFNNRLYLRVTTPDGRVLQGAKIKVKRAWQPSDVGVEGVVDEDGVAALQIDPGAPVNVVVPAQPWRPAPRRALVRRGEPEELIGGEGAPLADQLEMDRWLAAMAPCSKWYSAERSQVRIGLRVSAAGAISLMSAAAGEDEGDGDEEADGDEGADVAKGGKRAASPLAQCALAALRGARLPAGSERMYAVDFAFSEPDLPSLQVSIEGPHPPPAELEPALQQRAASARDCLSESSEGPLPQALSWRVQAGSRQVQLGGWIADPNGAAAAMGCATAAMNGAVALRRPAAREAFGLVRFTAALPERTRQQKPQPTMMLGYELAVSAEVEGAPATKLRLPPGEIPPLRMRLTPVLAKAGEEITAELIRGPSFSGELPEKLRLSCLAWQKEEKLDAERRTRWKLPAAIDGWCEVRGGGVRALAFIKPANDLTVSIQPEQPRYAPGDQAQLKIQTKIAGVGGKAAVGLFGVDESLGQLIPLPGAGELDRLRSKVETSAPAFGSLDGQALTLGRIQGANAAAATVLRVSSIPGPPELDAVVSASSDRDAGFDAVAELTDRFYTVLGELYAQARQWEKAAPATEKMRPETMAQLWKKALAACKKRGERIDDAFGRELRLRMLPADLLALTAPEAVITGTRLPEDVENWSAWVARKRP